MKQMERLLIIDDEANLCRELSLFFRSKGFETHTALSRNDGLRVFREVRPHYVICDVRLPDGDGLSILSEVTRIDPDVYVIMITAYQDMETTVSAMQHGAFDYIDKPFDPEKLEIVVNKARENRRLTQAVTRLQAERIVPIKQNVLVGKSKPMLEIYKTIGVVSSSNATVLITGESGTGKELVARAIHANASPHEPFISVNCSAIVDTLLESELFGHEKGAFTGASYRKQGKFELAGKGTIFLDEIGDMSPGLQTKLLRVLQEREFTRVGGSEVLRTEARVVTATNRNLETLVADNRFREDLYYRLKVITIHVPPLKDRREDIPLLVEHFLQKINAEVHKEVYKVPDETLERLARYDWRGNVRELENVLTRAVVLSKGEVLELPAHSLEASIPSEFAAQASPYRSLQDVEAQHISRVLDATGWHQGKACGILGISRPTLRKKIREYGLKETSPNS
jgi:two-component system response regulator AtoC